MWRFGIILTLGSVDLMSYVEETESEQDKVEVYVNERDEHLSRLVKLVLQ